MKTVRHILVVIAMTGLSGLPAIAGAAEATAPPAASRFYPLVGAWKGMGQMSESGQPPEELSLLLTCRKVSAGWAVACELDAKNDKMHITESDLFGVDPATGQGHWYAVTNLGETHDHLATWTDAHNMKGALAWTEGSKRMAENIAFKLSGERNMEFRSVTTVDGKEAGAFSGKLKR